MKRIMFLAAALTFLMIGQSQALITGSAHDFSSMAWSGGEICKPCHTPHNAIEQDVTDRLWNHTLSTTTYKTAEGDAEPQDRIDGSSRLCLSCHDGTVALDSFGGTTGTSFIGGSAKLGTDLSNDHPIGYAAVYNPGQLSSSTGLYRMKAMKDANKGTIAVAGRTMSLVQDTAVVSSYTNGGATDVGGVNFTKTWVVSCRTCHNVHNAYNTNDLLVAPNTASQLCLACHNK